MKATRFVALLPAALILLRAGPAETQARTSPAGPDSGEVGFSPIRYYSSQSVVCLNPGETYSFRLKNGTVKSLRLESVRQFKDSVIGLTRRADVRVEIDGQPLDLVCAPYVMPSVAQGLRVQVDTTSAWGDLPKQVQFSLWDASDPIVDTRRFGFPLRDYQLFCHGTQAYNEVVHLGAGDGDPVGQRFHHDYGVDLAGFEGHEEVVSAVEGKIIKFWPSLDFHGTGLG